MKTYCTGPDGRDIKVATPAKINLFFELLGKRSDGFHEVETVMASVSLFDELYFRRRTDGKIRLSVTGEGASDIPTDHGNLVYQAVDRLRQRSGSDRLGCDVVIKKRIPAAAGLGGASGNAAGALLAAKRLWDMKEVSDSDIWEIASELGSDVPFFLSGGVALCTGRGEKIKKLTAPAGLGLVIAKPKAGLSTREVYRHCKVPDAPQRAARLVQHMQRGAWPLAARSLFNRLEIFASSMSPAIEHMKNLFGTLDCLGHQMSGSGSAYFGLFRNLADATRAAKIATRRDDTRIYLGATTGIAASAALPVVG